MAEVTVLTFSSLKSQFECYFSSAVIKIEIPCEKWHVIMPPELKLLHSRLETSSIRKNKYIFGVSSTYSDVAFARRQRKNI